MSLVESVYTGMGHKEHTMIDILRVTNLPTYLMTDLQSTFTVHDRDHITDPSALQRIRAMVGGGDAVIDKSLMALFPALEFISVCGVGYDGVDVIGAMERGIKVSHTPGVLNDDVADLALGLMLSIARRIPQADKFVRNSDWVEGPFPLQNKMTGARLGLVGIGRIGQAIAKRAAAFDMSIAYTARHEVHTLPFTYYPSAKDLAAQVDYLVVITPGGPATRNLINAEVLQALGHKGCLINVARGSVVDQAALIEALQKKVIAGAALDVFTDEPRVPAELRNLQNVVLTPHIASGTVQTRRAMAALAFANLNAHFEGQAIPALVPEWANRV
jgi:lactate dehydrogenase-like 2-hydroxyacid dehydrogenase